jgi:hypothetical protein
MAECDRNCCLGLSASSSALVISIYDQNVGIKAGSFTSENKTCIRNGDFCVCYNHMYMPFYSLHFSLMILCIKDHKDTYIIDHKETVNMIYSADIIDNLFFFIFCIFNHKIFSYICLWNEGIQCSICVSQVLLFMPAKCYDTPPPPRHLWLH